MSAQQLQASINSIFQMAAQARLAALTEAIARFAGNRVLSGPFAGMELLSEATFGNGGVACKLIGCVEAELHAGLERAIARRPVTVVNVGCAEGYYAVGLALRLPDARVFAFDIDENAQRVCRAAAAANGVADRVVVAGLCTPAALQELAEGPGRAFVLMDCEGGELQLLDEATVDRLAGSDVLVEAHDFLDRSITPTLEPRLRRRHTVEVVREGARDPGAYPFLRNLSTLDRWLAVCEFRPEVMHWLLAWG